MNIKDFMSDQEVEYSLVVKVGNEQVGRITALSLESLQEQLHKIENVVTSTLERNYADHQAEQAEHLETA